MKTTIKRTIGFFVSFAMIVSLMCSTAIAAEPTEEQNATPHRVSYTIYREDGTIKETGIMAMSEAEANARGVVRYGRVSLDNGERVTFKNGNSNFYADKNTRITFNCGLNQNANISAGMVTGITTFASWTGFTGGVGFNGIMPHNGYFYAYVKNSSATTIAVTWATIEF